MNIRKIDTFSGHRDSVYSIISDQSANQFFSAGGDGYIISWNLENPDLGNLVAKAGASVYAINYHGPSESLWIGQNYEGIQILNTKENRIEKSSKITQTAIFDIQFLGSRALIALGDGIILVMDIPTFSVQKHIKVGNKSIRSIAINPASNEIAVGDSEHRIHIFDADNFLLKKTIASHQNSVFTVCYSPDGKFLLTSGRDASLKIWDVNSDYSQIESIPAHMYAINHITYSPDGKYFATASMDKSIKIWDAATFKLKKVIDKARHAGHGTSVNKLLWTKYKNQLVSCGDDRMISIWEVEN